MLETVILFKLAMAAIPKIKLVMAAHEAAPGIIHVIWGQALHSSAAKVAVPIAIKATMGIGGVVLLSKAIEDWEDGDIGPAWSKVKTVWSGL